MVIPFSWSGVLFEGATVRSAAASSGSKESEVAAALVLVPVIVLLDELELLTGANGSISVLSVILVVADESIELGSPKDDEVCGQNGRGDFGREPSSVTSESRIFSSVLIVFVLLSLAIIVIVITSNQDNE